MLYREIIAVFTQIRTKHTNILCGRNVETLNVKPGGTYSNHWALKGLRKWRIRIAANPDVIQNSSAVPQIWKTRPEVLNLLFYTTCPVIRWN